MLKDLNGYIRALVPEEGYRSISGTGQMKNYLHCEEGSDDMPAHIRTSLTSTTLGLSIHSGKLLLGTWQAIYLWEHRSTGSFRKLAIHAIGDFENSNKNR